MPGDDLKAWEIEIRVSDAQSTRVLHGEIRSETDRPEQITESLDDVLERHYGERRWRVVDPAR